MKGFTRGEEGGRIGAIMTGLRGPTLTRSTFFRSPDLVTVEARAPFSKENNPGRCPNALSTSSWKKTSGYYVICKIIKEVRSTVVSFSNSFGL